MIFLELTEQMQHSPDALAMSEVSVAAHLYSYLHGQMDLVEFCIDLQILYVNLIISMYVVGTCSFN